MSTTVTVEALRDEIKNGRRPQMIDVRTPSEYAGGHIPCAVNIPMDSLRLAGRICGWRMAWCWCARRGRAQIVAGWLGADSGRAGAGGWHRGLDLPGAGSGGIGQDALVAGAAGASGGGVMVLTGTVLAVFGVHGAIWLAMFVGAGLTFAGATDICMMGDFAGQDAVEPMRGRRRILKPACR